MPKYFPVPHRVEHPAPGRQRRKEPLDERSVGVLDLPPSLVVDGRQGVLLLRVLSPEPAEPSRPIDHRAYPPQRRRTRMPPASRRSRPARRVTDSGTRSRPNSPTESITRLARSCPVIRTANVPNAPIRGGANVSTASTAIPSMPPGTHIHGD